ncbi:MazG family protein [Nocardioides sp.]|uniref:MazG family protein n=1 Tax=Nocardioides sp. TaxID=35761 RepID=UPI002C5A1B20|nr:MazG family protein [Nocardioides sp.]HXH79059.1 MazG family protein [Nocardioides sp.]
MTEGQPLVDFIEVMRRLRAECPWKAEQTHRSLARYLLEETHETLEAIDLGDPEHLREELGDVLLQIYFHAAIASEAGHFTIDDVAAGLTEKMVRRNPHVFAPGPDGPGALSAAEVNEQWQHAKAGEKHRSSVTDGLPPGLPALLYADKVLERLERSGLSAASEPGRAASSGTSDDPVVGAAGSSDVPDTPDERSAERLGKRLLDLVRQARAEDVDPEQALRDAVRREIDAASDG